MWQCTKDLTECQDLQTLAVKMLSFLSISFLIIYGLDILLLFFFGLHTYLMVYLYSKFKYNCAEDESLILKKTDKKLPIVTIQLPIFNEFYVIDRLIDAACSLTYPKDKLQIQVLDDSTDETIEKVRGLVHHYKKKGIWIEHIHRTNRIGHKAGALDEGMRKAKGEFIGIFDADFVPEPDFLLRTMGYFKDAKIGMVQTRWGHLNEDYNILTKAQSFGIDGHFMIEQVARNGSSLWMNFNGTAGIWRRSCIEDAGGWEHDTLTEDFDLSYRAELKGWKFRYIKDVVCKAEIPATVNAYKAQQFRWCKGSIQTAVKLLPTIWNSNESWKIKAEAITHLINYSVHPLMILNILLTAPLLLMEYWAGFKMDDLPIEILFGSAALLSIGSLGPVIFYAYSQKEIYKEWKAKLVYLPVLVMIGTGIAVMNTYAWMEAVFGIQSGFKRTPKLRLEGAGANLKERMKYVVPVDYRAILEFFMGLYCLLCIYLSFLVGKPYVVGFMVLYSIGFFYVSFLSIAESFWKFRPASKEEKEASALA
jgi:cellulose synthase/poly-beta-1,6-N-acetylglucosamine synthase-like glycosyltransferase